MTITAIDSPSDVRAGARLSLAGAAHDDDTRFRFNCGATGTCTLKASSEEKFAKDIGGTDPQYGPYSVTVSSTRSPGTKRRIKTKHFHETEGYFVDFIVDRKTTLEIILGGNLGDGKFTRNNKPDGSFVDTFEDSGEIRRFDTRGLLISGFNPPLGNYNVQRRDDQGYSEYYPERKLRLRCLNSSDRPNKGAVVRALIDDTDETDLEAEHRFRLHYFATEDNVISNIYFMYSDGAIDEFEANFDFIRRIRKGTEEEKALRARVRLPR